MNMAYSCVVSALVLQGANIDKQQLSSHVLIVCMPPMAADTL